MAEPGRFRMQVEPVATAQKQQVFMKEPPGITVITDCVLWVMSLVSELLVPAP